MAHQAGLVLATQHAAKFDGPVLTDCGCSGFMYVASIPSLELYRHPLPSLVSHVATALAAIRVSSPLPSCSR